MVIIKFLLFNREEILIGTLKDIIAAHHLEEINGENILEITTLDKREIKKGYRIIYKDIYGYWHEFIIRGIDEVRGNEGIEKHLFCESSFYETLGDYVEDRRPYNTTANIALENALLTTRWQVGQVDDLRYNSTNFYHISAKEAVQKVAETWQGEIRTRITISGNKITGRYVDLYAQRGHDLGKRFTYTKDLESITKTIHRDDVITALYGYGKGEEIEDEEGNATGGFGRRIDFAEINDGKAYVENNDAREIWGRNHNGEKVHVFGKVEFDDCEDKEELLDLTIAKLEELSQPLITYQAKVIDLKAFGFEHEGVELGDTVTVIDKEFTPELRIRARVVKIVRDLLEPENNDITLGNFITNIADSLNKQEEYINNFRGKQAVWDRSNIIGSDNTINTQYLEGVIDVLKTKLDSTQSGWYTDENGNIVFENHDKTESMMLTGAGFMIANSKNPDGSYNYRTFGTGAGFTADEFIAGILKGGKVKFDLTNGTLLIGNSVEDYLLLFDGQNLKINLSGKSLEEKFEEIEDDIKDIELTPGPPGKDGEQGPPGKDGLQGPPGQDGKSQWVHIRYSINSSGSPMTPNPNIDTKYIGIAVTENSTAPTDNKAYDWAKYVGDDGRDGKDGTKGSDGRDGIDGIPGKDGKDGEPTYTWIKYADTPTSGMSDYPEDKKYIGLAFNKDTATESTNYGDYQWSLMPQNIEVGGRNLVGNTGTLNSIPGEVSYGGTQSDVTFRGNASRYFNSAWQGFGINMLEISKRKNIKVGDTLTISKWYMFQEMPTKNVPFTLFRAGVPTNSVSTTIPLSEIIPNEWFKVSFTFTVTESTLEQTREMRLEHSYHEIEITGSYTFRQNLYASSLKLEKGDTPTDWTPAIEDVQEDIDSKANDNEFGDLQEVVGDIAGELEEKAEGSVLQQLQEEFEARGEQIAEDKEATEDAIMDLLSRVVGFEVYMGDKAALWEFIENSIRFSEEGIFVSNEDGSMGILISENRISFIDNDMEIAHIAGRTLKINHGIFVRTTRIGKHQIETLPDTDITAFSFVGGDD